MLFRTAPLSPAISVLDLGESPRDTSIAQQVFATQCERWLDHWYGGSAQRARLKYQLATRTGTGDEPRRQDPFSDEDEADRYLTDDGEAIRDETTELVCMRYVRSLASELAVLYASDDLERIYIRPDGSRDDETAATMKWYHSPARGGLTAALHLLDAWLAGLRTVGLLVGYSRDLEELTYQVLPPHWFHWWARSDAPTDPRLAYACAYSEPEARDERGRQIPASVWTVYVRPALPGDPPDAPTWVEGHAETGRLVRYLRRGRPWSDPWPIPPPGSSEILPDADMPGALADGPNPLVLAGGFEGGRRIWCPLVLHAAETLVSGLRLPVADDQSQLAEELDHGLSSALHTANLQSYGVPVFVGAGDPPRVIGPQHVVHCMDGGDFRYAAPAGKPVDHLDVVHRIASLAAVFEHLPADTFTFQPPSIETGPAKQLRRAGLIQERARRTIVAEQPEQRRWELERLLHNQHAARVRRSQIPLDTDLMVHWGELSTPTDWGQRLQEMVMEKSLGLSDTLDLLMERHGVDRQEAERRLSERAEAPAAPDRPSGGEMSPDPSGHAAEDIGTIDE